MNPGDTVQIRSYWPPRVPKWRVGDVGIVIKITSRGSAKIRMRDGIEYSAPLQCLRQVEPGTPDRVAFPQKTAAS